jgi:hypothetical protein
MPGFRSTNPSLRVSLALAQPGLQHSPTVRRFHPTAYYSLSSWTGLLRRLPGVAGSNFVLCWQQPARTDIRANRIAIGLFVISPSLISGVTRYRGTNFTDFGGAAVAVPKMPCGEYRFTCVFNLYRTVSASQSILFAL